MERIPPARQIPWPDIWRRHISLIEGHLKMVVMVRKHTIEGTGNWQTICSLIDRTKDMLDIAKSQSKLFTPSYDNRNANTLGSLADLENPGSPPMEYVNGKSPDDYRRDVFASSPQIKSEGVKHGTDHTKGKKRKLDAVTNEITENLTTNAWQSPTLGDDSQHGGSDDKSENPTAKTSTPHVTTASISKQVKFHPTLSIRESGRRKPTLSEPSEVRVSNSVNKRQTTKTASPSHSPLVEFEDISQEVDARMRAKEEKRKRKQKQTQNVNEQSSPPPPELPPDPQNIPDTRQRKNDQKRKRESKDSAITDTERPQNTESTVPATKKKKFKHAIATAPLPESTPLKKRPRVKSDGGQDETRTKKRKKR